MAEFVPTRQQVISAYRAERRALTRLVELMSDDEWLQQSDCEGWTIGEVAAHCTLGDGIPWRVGLAVIHEVGITKAIEFVQGRWAGKGREFVLERLRTNKVSIYMRWGWSKWRLISLAEIIIHSEDIRRPLGKSRQRPLDPALAGAILAHMGRRMREIETPGVLAISPEGLPETIFEISSGHAPASAWSGAKPDAVITGNGLEFILRLSGRPANLEVGGVGEFAEAVRAFASVRSQNVGTTFWR